MTTENTPLQTMQTSAQPAASGGPLTQEQAATQLEQLRADRIAGKVLDDDYLQQADYLARVAGGEKATPPQGPLTDEQRFEQQYVEAMTPPKDLHEYNLGAIAGADGAEAYSVAHTAIATALQAASIPAMYGSTIVDQANQLVVKFDNASDADVRAHLQGVSSQLQQSWGQDFAARKRAVDELVLEMAAAHPRIGEIVDARPWVIYGSPLSIELLDRVAQHRKYNRRQS